jgi:hypothetical protein
VGGGFGWHLFRHTFGTLVNSEGEGADVATYASADTPGCIRESWRRRIRTRPATQGSRNYQLTLGGSPRTLQGRLRKGQPIVQHYIDENSYPGLEHVGGVGFVEDKAIRPVDEEIALEEYLQIRNDI